MNRCKEIERAALAAWLIIGVAGVGLVGACAQSPNPGEMQPTLRSTIAFVSTRHDPTADPAVNTQLALLSTEIYLMNGDATNPRRLTENAYGDAFPTLSPDGSRIAFESNRLRSEGDPFNRSDLFVMNTDGTGQTLLTRGASATWSPDGSQIAFHASASGTGQPIKPDPGAATSDNDIFVLDVDDFLRNGARPRNITSSPEAIDDDPDWSPNGQTIMFTSHAATDNAINSVTAEIYTINADGTGNRVRLTNNSEEERAPAWSPDGRRIAFSCRRGGPDFELCVMNADGTGQVQLTDNDVPDLTSSWSPDGSRLVFNRRVGGARGGLQLFFVNADGTGEVQLTFPPGLNAFANWGELRDRGPAAGRTQSEAALPCCVSVSAKTIHHYVFFGQDREKITQASSFLETRALEGAQVAYSWRQLEPEKDAYDFSIIRDDLTFLTSRGKRLFIQLQDVTFSESRINVPHYLLRDAVYNGGADKQYGYKDGDEAHAVVAGWAARRWDPAVQERFHKLLFALGKEFDGRIEGINFAESSVDFGETGRLFPTGFSFEGYRDAIITNMKALKRAFPRSVAMQYGNFMPGEWRPTNDKGYLSAVYQAAKESKVGVGGPDLLPFRPGHMKGPYPLIREAAGIVPIGIAVQDGNLEEVNPQTGKPATVSELITFATEYLKVDYLFWGTQEPYYSEGVIPHLRRVK